MGAGVVRGAQAMNDTAFGLVGLLCHEFRVCEPIIQLKPRRELFSRLIVLSTCCIINCLTKLYHLSNNPAHYFELLLVLPIRRRNAREAQVETQGM